MVWIHFRKASAHTNHLFVFSLISIWLYEYHRFIGVGRDLWRLSIPTPLLTQTKLHRKASRQILNISGGDYCTASLGSLLQCSVILKLNIFFLMFTWNILCSSLCPLTLVQALGINEQSLALSSLHLSLRYLRTLMRSPWTSFSPGWATPAFSASPPRRDAHGPSSSWWPSIGLFPACPFLSCTEDPKLDPTPHVRLCQCWSPSTERIPIIDFENWSFQTAIFKF